MSGGDGMGGLALAILVVIGAIILAGLGIAIVLGRLLARRLKLSSGGTALTIAALGLAGLGIGAVVVAATFFETTFSPPPTLRFNLPSGFAHKWVILLEDTSAPREIVWRGFEGPFSGVSAEIDVPANGVLRVRGFGRMSGRADSVTLWSDGSDTRGGASGPAPAGLNASTYMALERGDRYEAPSTDFPTSDEAALVDYVRKREAAN